MHRDELVTTAENVIIGIFISGTNETMAQNATSATTNKTKSQTLGYNKGLAKTTFMGNNTTKYTDPQASFSIYYPTNWTVTPATNRFQYVLVTLLREWSTLLKS